MLRDFQIDNRVKEILNIINDPDKVKQLDSSTIEYYKIKILDEIDRLNKYIYLVPQNVQMNIEDTLITQLEGAIDKLNSINNFDSQVKSLVRRLDVIRGN